jgi:hypothetical protein
MCKREDLTSKKTSTALLISSVNVHIGTYLLSVNYSRKFTST